MNEGDIILIAMPQADQREKRRPALVLRSMPKYGDMLVCGISSQIHQAIEDFDLLLYQGSPEFTQSGLLADSVIRLGF